ncbi:acyl-CoA synthetase (AMP-forming)/AMP-acid ligase II [Streptomyces sp. 846.5]|nr:class I adenylate-forming enzyme family protein [Streptomyces sp. 846.5]TDT98513.1 acyl-CoA synthetase (AMP-forming)/AMP-acid ligase II [Streptomyces sp. 846.5]
MTANPKTPNPKTPSPRKLKPITLSNCPLDWTVPAQLRQRAAERPDATAHRVVDGATLTLAAWEESSNAVARGLQDRGVLPGDRVLLPCSTADWIDYAVAWVAVLKTGAVAVPVSQAAGAERTAMVLRASGAVGAVGAVPAGLRCSWSASVAELAEGRSTSTFGIATTRDGIALTPASDAEIIYTSGTTGVPRGVVATHANILYPLMHSLSRDDSTALHSLPPGTTVGQGLLVQPLGPSPHSVLTLPRFSPEALLRAVEQYRPTHVVLVPAMAIALVNAAARGSYELGSVRQVRTTSAPSHPATLARLAELFPTARIRNVYATTESWPRRMGADYDPARPKSLGRPSAGSQLRIVGADGRVAPPGVAGDVQLRSDAPQRRYDGETGAGEAGDAGNGASQVFLADGWTRTGDVGVLDADGWFSLVDRNPDLINTGGLNVSSLDVEATIMDYPGVIEAAVVGVPHPVLTECVMAVVRAAPGLATEALGAYVRERQGRAAPHRIVVMDDLPRNMLGRADKRRLRSLLADGSDADAVPSAVVEPSLRH